MLATGEPRNAEVRRLVEMLGVVQQLGFAKQAQVALNEARFDEAEALFRRLAHTGHQPSAKVVQTWSNLNRRRWLNERARDALESDRPRTAGRLLEQLYADPDRSDLSADRPWTGVEALRQAVDAAIAEDEALAKAEAETGVECWTTLAGEPAEIREVGGCPDGASEQLRDAHARDVERGREAYRSGPTHITTTHGG